MCLFAFDYCVFNYDLMSISYDNNLRDLESWNFFFKIGFFMYFEMCLKCVCGLVCVGWKMWVCEAVYDIS